MLTDSLRQMMDDGLVIRTDYQTNPPHVEYSLSELGRQLMPTIDSMEVFGNYYKSL